MKSVYQILKEYYGDRPKSMSKAQATMLSLAFPLERGWYDNMNRIFLNEDEEKEFLSKASMKKDAASTQILIEDSRRYHSFLDKQLDVVEKYNVNFIKTLTKKGRLSTGRKRLKQEMIRQKDNRHFMADNKHFFESREWKELRYEVLREKGRKCACCGATPKDGRVMHVDHIIPRSVMWQLSLYKPNLQVLCDLCNIGKSNIYTDKW